MKMDHFKCRGWLRVTVDDRDLHTVKVRLTHALLHPSYTDISLPDEMAKRIRERKDSPAGKVGDLSWLVPI